MPENVKVDVEIRGLDEEQRIVTGIAIPYGEIYNFGGVGETFTRGAIDTPDVPLTLMHSHPIGKVIEGLDTDAGYVIRARISKTTQGDDVITLIKDNAIRSLSVGFVPLVTDVSKGILNRVKVALQEVSLVAVPAYAGAHILDYRSDDSAISSGEEKTTKMEEKQMENIESVLTELREDVTELQRSKVAPPTTSGQVLFRSYGEYIKAYVSGDERATKLMRAYAGGTSADSVVLDSWVGNKVRIVTHPRKVFNAFSTGTLPPEGMVVEYAQLNGNTMAVAEQVNEGDDLVAGAVSITTNTAPIKTYGGYSFMSRQEIERANVNIVDTAFTAMAAEYAKQTNNRVRTVLGGTTPQTITGPALASFDVKGIYGMIVDAATKLDTYNYELETILVSPDVFKEMAVLVDSTGRPIMAAGNPSNSGGTASVAGLTATIAGVPIVVDPGAAAKTAWFTNSMALQTFESGGAPLRLQDSDIVNLTGAFSVYGYLAVAVVDQNALVKASIA